MELATDEEIQSLEEMAGSFRAAFGKKKVKQLEGLNMELHGADGCRGNPRVDKLVRDAMIWTHLAGDTVLRLKAVTKLKRPDVSVAAE